MKKRIWIVLVVITLLSAAFFARAYQKEEANRSPYIHLQTERYLQILTSKSYLMIIEVVKIDGCQYIISFRTDTRSGVAMVHKENCENPWHKEKH